MSDTQFSQYFLVDITSLNIRLYNVKPCLVHKIGLMLLFQKDRFSHLPPQV